MKKKRIALLIVAFIIIVGLIFFLESMKSDRNLDFTAVEQSTELKEGIYPLAPELTGIAGYINTEENLKLEDQRGKVVLIDFWTYTCINCIRTLPHLVEWDKKYRDRGLVIVGVHTPEFAFEEEYDNVKEAVERNEIEYAVVQDNDYETWTAYRNRYWPRKYLIDSEGFIRYDHIGEGAYEETERVIQELLAEINDDVTQIEISTLEDKTPRIRTTPELYAGYNFALSRLQNIGNEEGLQPDNIIDYTITDEINKDTIYLEGKWKSNADDLQAIESKASIILDFTASSVNIVADYLSDPIELEVFIDEEYITEEQAGKDVEFDGERAFILIDAARLYNIFNGEHSNHKLKLTANSKDFTFNAFTFG